MRPRALLLLAAAVLSACGERTPAADPGQLRPEDLTAVERQAFVYSAAIRHLVEAEGQDPRRIYVLERAVEDAADPLRAPGKGTLIAQGVQDRIREELALLGRVIFVSDRNDVVTSSQAREVRNEGVLVTLGPVPGGGNRVEVETASYRNLLAGSWQTLVLERRGLRWEVTGTVGAVAVS